jgi:hypothetical protein
MAYARTALAPRELAFTPAPTATRRGLLRRLLDALMESRRRQADREIARFLAGSGGKFTDEVEREIERRFLTTPPRW